jgi:hypothetical protein
MPYGTVNADVITTSTAGGVLGAGNASIMKNRIINGAMVIDQRNAGASVTVLTTTGYTLDRWKTSCDVSSKFSVQQNAGSVTPPVGFVNYLGATSLSAYSVPSGEIYGLQQCIEGYNTADLQWGTANAKTVTLSFWVRSSLTGTFGGSFLNATSDRSYPFSYSIPVANTWTQISVTVSGDTSGTWNTTTGRGIVIIFSLGTGTTYSGTAGSWSANNYQSATGATSVVGTNGATFYITGVQLEVGSSATGFEYVNYQTSLANCQRYFQSINDFTLFAGTTNGTTQITYVGITPTVPFRSAPTCSAGTWRIWSLGAGVTSTSQTPTATYTTPYSSLYVSVAGFTGLTDDRIANCHPRYVMTLSAEL